jgi:hypothetical protein
LVSKPARSEEICFQISEAQSLFAEIKTCRDTDKRIEDLFNKYSLEKDSTDIIEKNLMDRLVLTEEQYMAQMTRAEEYKIEWKSCGKALTDCEKKKVSRTKWFSIGAGSGLALALLIVLL